MLICGDRNMFQKSSDKRTKGRKNFYKARKKSLQLLKFIDNRSITMREA